MQVIHMRIAANCSLSAVSPTTAEAAAAEAPFSVAAAQTNRARGEGWDGQGRKKWGISHIYPYLFLPPRKILFSPLKW